MLSVIQPVDNRGGWGRGRERTEGGTAFEGGAKKVPPPPTKQKETKKKEQGKKRGDKEYKL